MFYQVSISLTNLDKDIEKLRVFSDFLIPSQFTSRCSFPRFEECVILLSFEHKFNLKNLFCELCGKDRKFLTYNRLLDKYTRFKRSPRDLSIECKKFFTFLNEIVIVSLIFNNHRMEMSLLGIPTIASHFRQRLISLDYLLITLKSMQM
jgi:hypothetical protein